MVEPPQLGAMREHGKGKTVRAGTYGQILHSQPASIDPD